MEEAFAVIAYYYFKDHLGSVRELVDGAGNIKTRYSYDPYGRATPSYLSGSLDATFQYARYYYHSTSGLNLTWFRGYDSNIGRWLSRDSYGTPSVYQSVMSVAAKIPIVLNTPTFPERMNGGLA